MKNNRTKNLTLSIGICVFFAVLGGLLTGDALDNWFQEISQPWFALPLWGWYVVGGLYYVMSIIVLFNILSVPKQYMKRTSLFLLLLILAGNELWNYLFFGLENTFLAFISLIPFSLVVTILFLVLWKSQRKTAWIYFLIYSAGLRSLMDLPTMDIKQIDNANSPLLTDNKKRSL